MLAVEHTDDVVVLAVDLPRLDAASATGFHQAATQALEGKRKAVFDLSSVDFMDSTGVGALVGVAKRLGSDGKAAVTGLTPGVKTIFSLLRMDMLFQVQPDRAAAVEALRAR